VIGFIGGTGPAGRGIALRLALVGERVSIGSRDDARAGEAAQSILALAPGASISGTLNVDVAREADLLFVTVPYAAQRHALEEVKDHLVGKIVVDAVAPLAFHRGVARAVPVAAGSAALEAQEVLPGSTVVAAFQTISARDLLVPDRPIDSDVVVCADDSRARETVMLLAEKIDGIRAVDGGGLENACYVESFTALLLNINRTYGARSAIRIVGI
jgi:NADPH-dependent F420 reductase